MTGPEKLASGLKLMGMTAFSAESSWYEKAMPPAPASNSPANFLFFKQLTPQMQRLILPGPAPVGARLLALAMNSQQIC